MGFYYGPGREPKKEKEPGGCLEVLTISRAVFGILAIPLAVLIGVLLIIVAVVWLFSIFWLLGLLGIAAIAGGIAAYARWERNKYRPGGV